MARRKLKVPGRIIGNEHRIRPIYWQDRYWGEDDKPATGNFPAISRWVRVANRIRTYYNSPFACDPRLQTTNIGDVDKEGRGRDGLPPAPQELDIEYVRKAYLTFALLLLPGIKGDGSPTHLNRCLPWGGGFYGKN